jgi:propanol-preferring alcohol dehydrogenase
MQRTRQRISQRLWKYPATTRSFAQPALVTAIDRKDRVAIDSCRSVRHEAADCELTTMRAQVLTAPGQGTLQALDVPCPVPGPQQLRLRVRACGVCRTDLHVVDGELPDVTVPRVPGHEIVGTVDALSLGTTGFRIGQRVGVPWLGWTCGRCEYCVTARENLCPSARFTGYHLDGGYAEYAVADARFCVAIPDRYDDADAAPLLCAGLIGYRAYRMAGPAVHLGIYGFGAAAHIIAQVALSEGRRVSAFVAPGDEPARQFAQATGATWAGFSDEKPPQPLDAALIFAPVGALVPAALSHVAPGGTVVCAGIHMSDIPGFAYSLLWGERTVRSVANLTRQDAADFFTMAARVPLRIAARNYSLADANTALSDLRSGRLSGAAVLIP